jgi:hypothetical protein
MIVIARDECKKVCNVKRIRGDEGKFCEEEYVKSNHPDSKKGSWMWLVI